MKVSWCQLTKNNDKNLFVNQLTKNNDKNPWPFVNQLVLQGKLCKSCDSGNKDSFVFDVLKEHCLTKIRYEVGALGLPSYYRPL